MTNFEWNFHNRGMPRSEPEDKQPFYFRSPSPVAKKVDCRILNSESPLFEFKVAIAIKEYDELKR